MEKPKKVFEGIMTIESVDDEGQAFISLINETGDPENVC